VSADSKTLDVAIIGAGCSGLYMLHRLRDKLGFDVRLFEAGSGVGGTWFWNRYPGARCDSESYYYSYSFDQALEQEWVWSSKYPEQPEIMRYLNHVADRFALRPDIQLDTRITSATFDEAADRWRLTTENGQSIDARFVVAATGCLSSRNVPSFEGLDQFQGEWYHTGAWPHEGVDFTGKRVGLIGTGSTGIQATPVIAAQSRTLTIFQRTPNYSVPARNAPLSPKERAEIKADYRSIRDMARASAFGFPLARNERTGAESSPEERRAVFEELWQQGGLRFLAGSYTDLVQDESVNASAADFIRQKIREVVKDPKVASLLEPWDHPYGTKRPPIDTDYYETFNRDNVTLVDVRTTPIVAITPRGLKTSDAEYDLDIIVFATGFDAMTGALRDMNVRGIGGLELTDKWEGGPRTYLGLQVAGFPNLFTVTGPQSPSVLTNMPVAIEQHVEWISDCLEYARAQRISRIEADPEAEEAWVKHVAELAEPTLYAKANSWYVGANVPGKTRVFMPYVGGMDVYREQCQEIAAKGYEGFVLTRATG
jgi:cation diffusion facilitator CzcD-associated flavoprotein CzcO